MKYLAWLVPTVLVFAVAYSISMAVKCQNKGGVYINYQCIKVEIIP